MTTNQRFYFTFLSLSLVTGAFAQAPSLDPNKFTVCFATINSDNEKKVFEKEMSKYPAKFNPAVELTTFGKDDWFEKACASGIKCDQLVISGHFGGDFFGSSKKTLPLTTLEGKGCDKSCSGILSQPYEVFLFGCNTLSTREKDSRTPAQYLQVLLNDGIDRAQAELVVESRYGTVGDDHKSKMQRAFAGENKNLYGFTSIGPSGKNVEKFVVDYFSKIRPDERLEKLQATRMMNKVQAVNNELADSLKITAFSQCNGGNNDDENSVIICKLRDDKVSLDQKLAVVEEAFTKDNYLLFIPSMNEFFKYRPVSSMSQEQQKVIEKIKNNQQIVGQIRALIKNTKSLSLSSEWTGFAHNIGVLTEAEKDKENHDRLKLVLKKGITRDEVDMICSTGEIGKNLSLKPKDLRSPVLNELELEALGCLRIKDVAIQSLIADGLKSSKLDVRIGAINALTYLEVKDSAVLTKMKTSLASQFAFKHPYLPFATMSLMAEYGFADPKLKPQFKKYFNAKESWQRSGSVQLFAKTYRPTGAEKLVVETALKKLYLASANADPEEDERGSIIRTAGILRTQDPVLLKYIMDGFVSDNDQLPYASEEAISEMKPTDPAIHKFLFKQMTDGDPERRRHVESAFANCKHIAPEMFDQMIEMIADRDPNTSQIYSGDTFISMLREQNKTQEFQDKIMGHLEESNSANSYDFVRLLDNGVKLSDKNLRKIFTDGNLGYQTARSNLVSSHKPLNEEDASRIIKFLNDPETRMNAVMHLYHAKDGTPGLQKDILNEVDKGKKIDDPYLRMLIENLNFNDAELTKKKEAVLSLK